MLVYNYAEFSGIYIGASEANPNPRVDGDFLIPRLATDIAPPKYDINTQFVCWDGMKWAVTTMHTPEIPPASAPPVIGSVRTEKLAALAAYRFGVETGGIVVAGVAISTDRKAQGQLTSAYVALHNQLIASVQYKLTSGWFTFDAISITPIFEAVSLHVQTCFTLEHTHDSVIRSLTTIEDIAAYSFDYGWPSNS